MIVKDGFARESTERQLVRSVVVEMIEPGMITQAYVYWTMAQELGHEYWYFIADSVPQPGKQNDTAVPLSKLRGTLDQIRLPRTGTAPAEGPHGR